LGTAIEQISEYCTSLLQFELLPAWVDSA